MTYMNSICGKGGRPNLSEQYACVMQTKIISCQQRKLSFAFASILFAIILPYVIPMRR